MQSGKNSADLLKELKEIGESKMQQRKPIEQPILSNPIQQEQQIKPVEIKEVKQQIPDADEAQIIPPPEPERPPERLIDDEVSADVQIMLARQAAALADFSHKKGVSGGQLEKEKPEIKQEINLDPDVVMPTLFLEDFICPITQQIFIKPVDVRPCGHRFEKDALSDWRKKHNNCPCCGENIAIIYPVIDKFFKNLFNELLKKNPILQNQRYCSLNLVVDLEVVMPTLSLEDFICPITQQIFINPVDVRRCGHRFETDALSDWRKNHNNCPCCRGNIDVIYPVVDKFFQKLLNKLLKKNPILQNQRYFSLRLLENCLKKNDQKKIKEMLDSLSIEQMNARLEEKGYEGQTIVGVVLSYDSGLQQILVNDKCMGKIQPQGLNAIMRSSSGEFKSDEGAPLVFILFSYIKFGPLLKKRKFRAKIPAEGLNAIVEVGESKGASAVLPMFSSSFNRDISLNDHKLLAKIQPDGLNCYDEKKRVSPVNWLAAITGALLVKPELRAKITAKGLNVIAEDGTSGASELLESSDGRKTLLADARLCSLISKEALFSTIGSGIHEGKKPVDFLLNTPEGEEILKCNPDLAEKAGLNKQNEFKLQRR
jgi:hypothetical protein